jgi:caspase domain-containing protein
MSRSRPSALRFITLTTLAVAAIACGSPEKSPDDKAIIFTAPVNRKAGPSLAALSAASLTALAQRADDKGMEVIGLSDTRRGELASDDDVRPDDAYYDLWAFSIAERTEMTVTASSDDFDTVLDVFGKKEILATNDDSDGTNSELTVTLDPGDYGAVVYSYGGRATGSYEIRTSVAGGGPSSDGVQTSRLVSGPTLQDGSYFEDWSINGAAGDEITVTLRSDDFDTYLMVLRDGEIIASDDDGAGGTDSQITLVLPAQGAYVVRANSYGSGVTGAYTISMSTQAGGGRSAGFDGFGSGGDPDGRYAVLVGIDDYPGTDSDLRGPIEDARIMERVLIEKYGFDPANVVTLNDSDATRSNIAQGIAQHLGQAGPNGVAVFFYSGHGTQIGENIGLTGSLDPEPRGDGDEAIYVYGQSYESSVVLDEELGFLMETLDAGRSLVVVDACFSGEITRGSLDSPQSKVVDLSDPDVASNVVLPTSFITSDLKALDLYDMSLGFGDFAEIGRVFENPQRHLMWGASTEDQVSWTSGLGNGASVFTYFMGERMMEAGGSATFGDVQRLVHDDVVGYIEGDGNMTMQNPTMRGPNQKMTLSEFFRQR